MSDNKDVSVVLPYTCQLGEGPVWDTKNNAIIWLDILADTIHRYNPATQQHTTFKTGQMPGSIVLRKSGGIIAAMQDGFSAIDLDKETIKPIADPEANIPNNRFNDGKCDPEGRFWAGTMALNETPHAGSLYMLGTDLSITTKIKGTSISNGLAWSMDERTLYYIDTPTMQIVAYDYDGKSGSISNKRTVITVDKKDGNPDGMTIDTEGMLWIAHWDGWQVTRRNPDTGEILQRIPVPAAKPSCCTFGGDNMNDLYITSAKDGLTDEELLQQPLAGSLFVIKNCGYKGLPPFRFRG